LRIMTGPNGIVAPPAGSAAKAARAPEVGFEDVIDLAEGVRRITQGKGDDIVIESICETVTSEALKRLGGVPITLGYSAGRKTTIDVTDLIWKARGWPASLCPPNQRPRSPLRRAFGMLVRHPPISMSIRPSAVTIRQPRISLAYPIDIRRS
jgi:NADPH:quinone reductase-like Zn-dependent oxidoreductase